MRVGRKFSSVEEEKLGFSSSKSIENLIFPHRNPKIFACGAENFLSPLYFDQFIMKKSPRSGENFLEPVFEENRREAANIFGGIKSDFSGGDRGRRGIADFQRGR